MGRRDSWNGSDRFLPFDRKMWLVDLIFFLQIVKFDANFKQGNKIVLGARTPG